MKYRFQTNTMLACAPQSWSPSRQPKISQFKGMYAFIQFELWHWRSSWSLIVLKVAKAVKFSCSHTDILIFFFRTNFLYKNKLFTSNSTIIYCGDVLKYKFLLKDRNGNKNRSETHVRFGGMMHDLAKQRCERRRRWLTRTWRGWWWWRCTTQ